MKTFKSELKKHIEEKANEKISQYFEPQGVNPPALKAPPFELKELKPDVEEFDNSWENVVYLFFAEELPDCCNEINLAKGKKKELNETNKKNCMPRVNKDQFPPQKKHEYGYCLYVGSCREKIKKRMEHHLGNLSNTSGLHLAAWWNVKPVKIFALFFENAISADFLSLIEDSLWEAYTPIFGQKGPR
jgi:hypothetical protein